MSGKTGSSFQKTMRYMMPRNQKGWRWAVFNNMRVAYAMKSQRTQRKLSIGFYKMIDLSDLCIPPAICDNNGNVTLNSKHPHRTKAQILF